MVFLAYIILKLKTKSSPRNMSKLDFSLFEKKTHTWG